MLDQILQELYIGKTPELLEIEKLIGKIRKSNTASSFLTNPSYDKDMEKINRIFEDFFGFEVFSLMIDRSTSANAYTFPISTAIDIAPQYRIKENLLATSSGFKYNKEAGYCCVVHMYNGLLFDSDFTDSEILSVILHEIGHNFESVINDTLYYTTDTINVLRFIPIFVKILESIDDLPTLIGSILGTAASFVLVSNTFTKFVTLLMESIMKDPNARNVINIISIVADTIKEARYNMNYLKSEVLKYGKIPNILKNLIIRKVTRPTGNISENTADSFATIYGYGADLSSAMLKCDSKSVGPIAQRTLYSIPVLGQIIAIYDLPLNILVSAFDEHPSGIERAKLAKANLYRELKTAYLDPKMKNQIRKQIDDIDSAISAYESMSKNISNPKAYAAIFNLFMCNIKSVDSRMPNKSKFYMGNIDKIFNDVKLK